MEATSIAAARRQGDGKGAARRLRSTGLIPAVAYGKNVQPQSLSVSPKELMSALEGPLGRNVVLNLAVEGGESIRALLTDYQYHPVSRELLHADFLAVFDDAPVDVEIPLTLTGKPEGVVQGGDLRQVFRRIPVRCLPGSIPVKLEADVTPLGIDQMLHAEDLKLPEGVELRLAPRLTVAAVVGGRRAAADDDEAGDAAEGSADAAADATDEKK